jgi:hypothetical protein
MNEKLIIEAIALSKLHNLEYSISDDCIMFSKKAEEEKEVLFTNSIGEEFTKDITVYWYGKESYNIREININEFDEEDYDSAGSTSEIYITKETAYQKSIEYAHSKGEKIVYIDRGGINGYKPCNCPIWDWKAFYYKLAPKTEYRAWTMEDEGRKDLRDEWIKSKHGVDELKVAVMSDSFLQMLYNDYEHTNGTPIGKKIN